MMEFLIMHETGVHLLVCMNIWTKNSLPTDLAKMFSYIRIHSNEQNILNEFIGVWRTRDHSMACLSWRLLSPSIVGLIMQWLMEDD
jgi:hypothetical protein